MKPLAVLIANLFLIAILGVVTTLHAAEKTDENSEKANSDLGLKLALEEANSFDMYLGKDQKTKLKLQPQPLLRWSDPGAGEIYGGVFVWTHDGRPEVISAIFKWFSPYKHLTAELHSLSMDKVTAIRGDKAVWHPEGPGIELKPVDDAPTPSKLRVARLRQMRTIVKQFSARAATRKEDELSINLRLLTNPIYRYESEKNGVIDGALFAFVEATDPEVLVLVEARKVSDGYAWHCAFAQQNSVQFQVKKNDAQIWHVPRMAPPWKNVQDPSKPYIAMRLRK